MSTAQYDQPYPKQGGTPDPAGNTGCRENSFEAVGNDADRVEFRFRDANNRLDLKCARTSVPGTWLTVSHISGPTLIRTIQDVRSARARVEGPEQTEQFAQLAAVHQDWWTARVASSQEEVGARVEFVGDLEQGNFHVIAMSSLLPRMSEVVPIGALAEMQHDRVVRPAPLGPLALTGEAWLHAAEDVEKAATPTSSGDQIAVTDRTSRELDLRSFVHGLPGASGHVVDEDRDLARRDLRHSSPQNCSPTWWRRGGSTRARQRSRRWTNQGSKMITRSARRPCKFLSQRRSQSPQVHLVQLRVSQLKGQHRRRGQCSLLHQPRKPWVQSQGSEIEEEAIEFEIGICF